MRSTIRARSFVGAIVVAAACRASRVPQGPVPFSDVIAFGQFRIEQIDPGDAWNHDTLVFRARVTNTSDLPATLGLELHAIAGQWSPSESDRAVALDFTPNEQRWIVTNYRLRRLTTEAALRVSFGRAVTQHSKNVTVEDLFFRRWYPLGSRNPAATDLGAGLVEERTAHLILLAAPGTAAARDLHTLGVQREVALKTIAGVVGTDFPGRIRMVFYPDSATKTRATGHIGMGLAFDRNIVEIYSETQRLDPFHEVTHIVAEGLGDPPASFNEGLATYMTERLGGDALEHLGHPGMKIRVVACELLRSQRLIPLDSLLHYTDIGSNETHGDISYPESAAFIQFLVERRGIESFREAYRGLVNSADPATWRANELELRRLYGSSIQELERAWLASLNCSETK